MAWNADKFILLNSLGNIDRNTNKPLQDKYLENNEIKTEPFWKTFRFEVYWDTVLKKNTNLIFLFFRLFYEPIKIIILFNVSFLTYNINYSSYYNFMSKSL